MNLFTLGLIWLYVFQKGPHLGDGVLCEYPFPILILEKRHTGIPDIPVYLEVLPTAIPLSFAVHMEIESEDTHIF